MDQDLMLFLDALRPVWAVICLVMLAVFGLAVLRDGDR